MANTDKDIVIKLENIGKDFKLPHEKLATVKQYFVNLLKPRRYENFQALDNVSFTVKRGEFLGIVGSNGSGKSTLLKILAEIYQPTRGTLSVLGKVSPFIELGVGFNPELTARENIYLNAAILGLTKKETEEKFAEIIAFAELEKFIDQKLKNFSSGMQVRLAFSIAVRAQSDILLVDEVLAVGDSVFQQKCLDLFRDLKKQGKTIIFVSHALNIVEEFCDRVVYLERGRVKLISNAQEAVIKYLRAVNEEQAKKAKEFQPSKKDSTVKITNIKTFNKDGEASVFNTGEKVVIRIFYKASAEIVNPVFGIALYSEDGAHLNGPNTKTSGYKIPNLKKEGYIDYIVDSVPFLGGTYFISGAILDINDKLFDFVNKAANFHVVESLANQNGILKLNEAWQFKEGKDKNA